MLDAMLPAVHDTAEVTLLPPRRLTSFASRHAAGLPGPGQRDGNILWNGQHSWLFLGDTLPTQPGAVTDQSDGYSLIAVSGERAVTILKKLLSIDVERFGPHDVALTQAAHIPVKLWREDERYVLACFRSYAVALHHALVHAARG
jgi:sarcosine oxidase subunit gamma